MYVLTCLGATWATSRTIQEISVRAVELMSASHTRNLLNTFGSNPAINVRFVVIQELVLDILPALKGEDSRALG